jgi:putative CRISPR-associated protein (TIGR02619 family)
MEGKNLVFLVTVGSSLLENIPKNNSKFGKTDLDNVSKKIDEKYLSGVDITKPITDQFNLAKKVFENIKSNSSLSLGDNEVSFGKFYSDFLSNSTSIKNKLLSNRGNDSGIEDLSAELKTLSLLLKELNIGEVCRSGNCETVLFPTLTYAGVLVSAMLAELIKSTWGITNLRVVFSEQLTSADELNFRDGIKNFIGNLYGEIRKARDERKEAFIIASGGYKAVVPYANIVGVLTKIGVYYAYEDSSFLIKLPSFPFDIKDELIKANQINLNVLAENKDKKEIYNSLPEELKNLFIEEDVNFKKSEFYDTIMSIYKDSIVKTPLQKQVSSMNILKKLGDNKKLLDYFTILSGLGSYFWIGDKIPELVDHAQYHHSNLFIIADTIMSQILGYDQNYFSPEEIFLILGTIYFHDWGHVLSSIDDSARQLLPTEIRDLHHILSFNRLKTECKKLYDEGLKWSGSSEELQENYLQYIALLSLYHRKAMPLLKNDKPFYFYVTGNTYGPLVEVNELKNGVKLGGEKLNGNTVSSERFVFLEALFRVIDSLDTQFVRAGSIDELIFKFRMFEVDAETEEKRLENLEKSIPQRNKARYNKIYEAIKQGYQGRANKGEVNNSDSGSDYDLNELLKEDPLLFLYLESKLKIMFRTEQRQHFVKHLFLDTPQIEVEKNNNNFEIKVLLKKNADFEENFEKLVAGIKEESRKYLEDYKKTLELSTLCKDIASDYEKVKGILNEQHLFFKFMIKDENGEGVCKLESEEGK